MMTEADAESLDRGGYRAEALISLLRLRWFIHLRWIMVLCSWLYITLEHLLNPAVSRPAGLTWTLVVLTAVNVLWMGVSVLLRRYMARVGESDRRAIRAAVSWANAQIAVDLLLLTAILRYTGGIENPMAIFYLFHMAIASLLLGAWQAMLQGVWAFALYVGMGVGGLRGVFVPHYGFLPGREGFGLHTEPAYVWAMAIVVGCGIFGTLYFTLRIAARLDERERVLRAVNQALRDSQQLLQELQRRKAQFMRTAAHQLKSPLAVIQTQVGLIRDGLVPKESLGAYYEKVIRRCREAIDQVTDLLTFARLQEVDPQRKGDVAADSGKILSDLCERFAPLAVAKGLQLVREIGSGEDLTVPVEPLDLADALGNLIDNAIKYTPSPGRVRAVAAREGEMVCLVVEDSGLGMPVEAQQEMFDAYRRGRLALEAGITGSGLGLSIVRAVVEQAGGEIAVWSRPGEGSRFSVRLPSSADVGPGGTQHKTLNVVRIE